MIVANGIQGNYLEYQGRPLVRKGDEIYLGDILAIVKLPIKGSEGAWEYNEKPAKE